MVITAVYKDHSTKEFRVKTPIGVDFNSMGGALPSYFVVSQDITSSEKQYLTDRCKRQFVEESLCG